MSTRAPGLRAARRVLADGTRLATGFTLPDGTVHPAYQPGDDSWWLVACLDDGTRTTIRTATYRTAGAATKAARAYALSAWARA